MPRPARLGAAALGLLVGLSTLELWLRHDAGPHPLGTLAERLALLPPVDPEGVNRWGHAIEAYPDPRLVYRLRPGIDLVVQMGLPARITTSSDGFRGPEVERPKPPGTVRIVGLGDSFMLGAGVSYEESYGARLQQLLSGLRPEVRWEFVNTAVGGYNTDQEARTLELYGPGLEPDMLLLGLVDNDFGEIIYTYLPPGLSLNRSLLYTRLREALEPSTGSALGEVRAWLKQDLMPWGSTREGHPPTPDLERDPARFARGMLSILAFARERDIPVLAFITDRSPNTGAMLNVAHTLGFEVRDQTPMLEAELSRGRAAPQPYHESSLSLTSTDGHPSAEHHALIAADLASAMESLGLQDRMLVK